MTEKRFVTLKEFKKNYYYNGLDNVIIVSKKKWIWMNIKTFLANNSFMRLYINYSIRFK